MPSVSTPAQVSVPPPNTGATHTPAPVSPTTTTAAHPATPSLHDRVMADAHAQAAQGAFSSTPYLTAERYRRLSWDFEQRRGSNPLSRGINP
ncbi:hypothetical protein CC85DRAFT_43386 [Cutaneotrichosporon oleaginosum]|uniref:Uncharacterized protein n=1 Tax=Cutaneotrichosporon oleaginosum TaxID=879819 RepID=A0A0J0XRL0_9TREE|nr:uncharacterized protein CC85DRAFT_43386 [Cutaneotrichosporon oleaginosum]KLT43766.1 hypothetical protein CC85DRAFT_43386 [Cutaneotrichosporon oleaginosum]TXT05182.1 hypothetical protein COLE_06502 [Cutaneotrichosporon oleaginosum]